MQLLGSTKSKMKKDKNGKNMPYLEINEVVLMHCNVAIIVSINISESCIHFFLINCSVNY